jgi:hypothetical protein
METGGVKLPYYRDLVEVIGNATWLLVALIRTSIPELERPSRPATKSPANEWLKNPFAESGFRP